MGLVQPAAANQAPALVLATVIALLGILLLVTSRVDGVDADAVHGELVTWTSPAPCLVLTLARARGTACADASGRCWTTARRSCRGCTCGCRGCCGCASRPCGHTPVGGKAWGGARRRGEASRRFRGPASGGSADSRVRRHLEALLAEEDDARSGATARARAVPQEPPRLLERLRLRAARMSTKAASPFSRLGGNSTDPDELTAPTHGSAPGRGGAVVGASSPGTRGWCCRSGWSRYGQRPSPPCSGTAASAHRLDSLATVRVVGISPDEDSGELRVTRDSQTLLRFLPDPDPVRDRLAREARLVASSVAAWQSAVAHPVAGPRPAGHGVAQRRLRGPVEPAAETLGPTSSEGRPTVARASGQPELASQTGADAEGSPTPCVSTAPSQRQASVASARQAVPAPTRAGLTAPALAEPPAGPLVAGLATRSRVAGAPTLPAMLGGTLRDPLAPSGDRSRRAPVPPPVVSGRTPPHSLAELGESCRSENQLGVRSRSACPGPELAESGRARGSPGTENASCSRSAVTRTPAGPRRSDSFRATQQMRGSQPAVAPPVAAAAAPPLRPLDASGPATRPVGSATAACSTACPPRPGGRFDTPGTESDGEDSEASWVNGIRVRTTRSRALRRRQVASTSQQDQIWRLSLHFWGGTRLLGPVTASRPEAEEWAASLMTLVRVRLRLRAMASLWMLRAKRGPRQRAPSAGEPTMAARSPQAGRALPPSGP